MFITEQPLGSRTSHCQLSCTPSTTVCHRNLNSGSPPAIWTLVHHQDPAGSTKINDRTDPVISPVEIFTRAEKVTPSLQICSSVILPRAHWLLGKFCSATSTTSLTLGCCWSGLHFPRAESGTKYSRFRPSSTRRLICVR
ncbi:hypothetical protein T08_10684 [Trichinella sp. T8]|nr:hypothetical protein T08_10684 [Trichinella sp. T8]